MAVKFNVVSRGNPSNPAAPKKFYPSIESSGRKTARQLAEHISQFSTVSRVDTIAVIEALLTVIPQELAAGNIVQLGDFGSFWLRTSSDGAETEEAVRANQIKSVLPRFSPGKEFKTILRNIEFHKA